MTKRTRLDQLQMLAVAPLATLLVALLGCPPTTPSPPVAVVGEQTSRATGSARLDASDSFGAEGAELSFRWKQIDGPPAVIAGPLDAATLDVRWDGICAAVRGTFEVTVSDGFSATTATATVTVEALNFSVNAGEDQQVIAGDAVTLSAAHDNPGNRSLETTWTQIDGPTVSFNVRSSGQEIELVAPDVATPSVLTFLAAARDPACGLEMTDSVSVNIEPRVTPPPQPISKPVPVVCDFQVGDEGWRLVGGDFSAPTMPLFSTGQQYITIDTREFCYWTAPDAFKGNLSRAYGRALEFDAGWEDSCCTNDPVVVLAGLGVTLTHRPNYPARPERSSFSIHLDETERWNNEETGQRASAAEIQTVLADVTQLSIRTGRGYSWLDHVVFGTDPAPVQTAAVGSDFAAGTDGWRLAGGNYGLLTEPTYDGVNGYVLSQDGRFASWLAPPKFRGDFSALVGRRLVFDAAWDDRCCSNLARVVIYGGGHELSWSPEHDPAPILTSLGVRLDETGGWRTEDRRATRDEILETLRGVQMLRILSGGNGASILDNARLGAE